MKDFIKEILIEDYSNEYIYIFNESKLLQYLDSKTGAIYGNSKTRRSLANIYAIYSIIYFYIEDFFHSSDPNEYNIFQGYDYMKLFCFYRSLYGGEKLQNHALNSRVNGEFSNKFPNSLELILINNGKYLIHPNYLFVREKNIAFTVKKIIEKYIELLKIKDNELIGILDELVLITNPDIKREKINILLSETAEARIFEIISYALLKNYYKGITVFIGETRDEIEERALELYKTGRTNANDGGIDFVMKPLGRFFQVTEVGNYDKYLLDIDKVIHFPITFVIKTEKTKEEIKTELKSFIDWKSGGLQVIKERYKNAIEDIITINELRNNLSILDTNCLNDIIRDIDLFYRLEFNI